MWKLLMLLLVGSNIWGMDKYQKHLKKAYRYLESSQQQRLAITIQELGSGKIQESLLENNKDAFKSVRFKFNQQLVTITVMSKTCTTCTMGLSAFKGYYSEIILDDVLFENEVYSEVDLQKEQNENCKYFKIRHTQ